MSPTHRTKLGLLTLAALGLLLPGLGGGCCASHHHDADAAGASSAHNDSLRNTSVAADDSLDGVPDGSIYIGKAEGRMVFIGPDGQVYRRIDGDTLYRPCLPPYPAEIERLVEKNGNHRPAAKKVGRATPPRVKKG